MIEQLRQARPASKFLELVHRLDRETSGILLVAKRRSALKHLQDQFRERETGKTYLALVRGEWPANRKVIDVALHKTLDARGERHVLPVAAEWGQYKINVNCICPGFFVTKLAAGLIKALGGGYASSDFAENAQ